MKTKFEHDGEIIATADLLVSLHEEDWVKIFGKDYVVFEISHEVEIHTSGCEEKVICSVITKEERLEWERWHK